MVITRAPRTNRVPGGLSAPADSAAGTFTRTPPRRSLRDYRSWQCSVCVGRGARFAEKRHRGREAHGDMLNTVIHQGCGQDGRRLLPDARPKCLPDKHLGIARRNTRLWHRLCRLARIANDCVLNVAAGATCPPAGERSLRSRAVRVVVPGVVKRHGNGHGGGNNPGDHQGIRQPALQPLAGP